MRHLAALIVALALTPTSLTAAGPTLLLDTHTVAGTNNLTQEFHSASRHPANPVMKRSQRWEGVGPYVFGNRMLPDPATGDYRLWYIAYDFTGNFYRWGYATSRDGLQWTKPELNLETVDGKPAGNCLPLGPHPEKGTRSIAFDPRPATPAERRYIGVRFTYEGEFVSFSPDGIHWTEHPQKPLWHVPSDMIHVMFDDRRQQFVGYFKLWELSGTRIDGTTHEATPFTALMPTFDPKPNSDSTTTFTGPVVHCHAGAAATVTKETFTLKSDQQGADDGGGTSLSGAWSAKRVQAWARSEDGIHWTDEQVVLRADEKDPPTANIQYFFVMQRGGYYIGFPTLHDERGLFELQLAWSADGIHWTRSRQIWLAPATGAFDSGMVLGPADPIIKPREMWYPYGGFPITHNSTRTDWEAAIGIATTRLDGFASWHAGTEPGELTTQPVQCDGEQLTVNANIAGELRVEVLDDVGLVIPGFERTSCNPITGDSLAGESPKAVEWKAGSFADLKGRSIQLRFVLTDGDLYAYQLR